MIDVAAALIESAGRSLVLAAQHPIEARRAVSACYYAVYHALAKAFADALIGADEDKRPQKAWVEVYRGLDHAACLNACKLAVRHKVGFPEPLMIIAEEFEQLQRGRHAADYDPREGTDAQQAGVWLNTAKDCVEAIANTERNDILAFATWVLISTKGAKETRASLYPAEPTPPSPKVGQRAPRKVKKHGRG
jgi:hypothetical protein